MRLTKEFPSTSLSELWKKTERFFKKNEEMLKKFPDEVARKFSKKLRQFI